ncbi:neuropeptide B-like [Sinocyclocheilus rhinocerous]|uniref:neuropeptide B-like n=1 Tax=Sinocyclocheilus rhinocerous TaxID=307959 RepID=UPI0007B866DB|nr:PREDICTED: neuropeptide B-like [Sinocyclocheilus rhinocerous]
MERSVRSVLVFVAVSILISSHPTDAWYKQSTGPSYYSVGRASGLLSGISIYAICVKDVSPNLQSCELVEDGSSTFRCKADVFLSLDSLDCFSS